MRRRFSVNKYNRSANLMSSHSAIFAGFDHAEASEYVSVGDVPPPLPPRHKDDIDNLNVTNSNVNANVDADARFDVEAGESVKYKCCNSNKCECYYEL